MESTAPAETSTADLAVPERASGAPPVYSGLRPVRTLAMLSIVGYHVSWQPLFGVAFGLTTLQVITCALATRRPGVPPLSTFTSKRAKRLLVPWLFWSACYGLFELARAHFSGEPVASRFEGWMWFSGTSFHLWFLPFAFSACVVANRGQHLMRNGSQLEAVFAAGASGIALVLTAGPLRRAIGATMPWDLWIDGAGTIAFGLAIGRALSLEDAELRRIAVWFVALLATMPVLVGELLLEPSQLYERYAVAVPLACAGLVVPLPESRLLERLASYNLGVYLVHMLAIRVVDHLPGATELPALPRTALVYAACLATVFLVRRLRIKYVA